MSPLNALALANTLALHDRDIAYAAGACRLEGRVSPCSNKRVDLSFRALGVCYPIQLT